MYNFYSYLYYSSMKKLGFPDLLNNLKQHMEILNNSNKIDIGPDRKI